MGTAAPHSAAAKGAEAGSPGHLDFARLKPRTPGVQAVYAYSATETAPPMDRPPHRGLPSPSLTVIISIEDRLLCSPNEADWSARRGASHDICIGGFHTRPVFLQRPDRQQGVQVGVHPLAARRLFGMPAAALAELTQEGDGVLGPRFRRLHSRIGSTADGMERAALVDREFVSLSDTSGNIAPPRREVVGTWQLLRQSMGRMPVAEVADRVGLSSRHLNTLVTTELGIGTKRLAGLFRFTAAHAAVVAEISDGTRPDLSRIAADTGYFDHSHLVRAYRRHAGTTPTGWIGEEFRNVQAGGHAPIV